MAGLLIRELELRGLAERILIVCPANLAFQWQRELKEKFDDKFLVMKGQDIRDQFGVNQWLERKQVITSLDLAKRTDILPGLRQVHWDLVIVDEAHRMSGRRRVPQEPALPARRAAARQLGPFPAAHRDAAQGRSDRTSASSSSFSTPTPMPTSSRSGGDGPPASAVLSAPHQRGDGLFPGATARRHTGRRSQSSPSAFRTRSTSRSTARSSSCTATSRAL